MHYAPRSHATQTTYDTQIGPRLELEIVKVEEGLCDGAVLYHAHESRTPAQVKEQQHKIDEREKLRAQRRQQQDVSGLWPVGLGAAWGCVFASAAAKD